MKSSLNPLVIGLGKIGSSVVNTLAQKSISVTGLARNPRIHYQLFTQADFIQADASNLASKTLFPFKQIIVIVSPDKPTPEGYTQTYLAIAKQLSAYHKQLKNLEHLIFISSTSVYGQNKGEWVDEETLPLRPTKENSQILLQAERTFTAAFQNKVTIIRPSEIYGMERLYRIQQIQKNNHFSSMEEKWTNRIMDKDLINIIIQVLLSPHPKALYLATDYQPVTNLQLTKWLCHRLKYPTPEFFKNHITSSGKRVHSNIPLAWLQYPDWKKGYKEILDKLSF
ncbi:NAD-dependent epimerase/dehydratase family protein [Suttonella ornithocola]|uniref:NADH-flavin reductase n=1 Tax=Suttonella ornithocola TaxID=279832 RepID=A0A380MW13_9GAMM|nr:NAD-dependent epimerase/dehydratase family protein [Suttonella ornithocola]SUO95901.1 Putative NADH-flavin reductase [Suttonella ornithocola]